jgi:hypothetical protein
MLAHRQSVATGASQAPRAAYLAGSGKVWLTGVCAGRLPVKIQVSLLK